MQSLVTDTTAATADGEWSLGRFRHVFSGEIVLPTSPDYDAARRVWNGVVDRRPA